MGRFNTDDQFKFLISCIRWSNNGKVDFVEVAKECSIISKGAAAKRYERLMKSHGIHQPANTRASITPSPKKSKNDKEESPPTSPSKKRKMDKACESDTDEENRLRRQKVKNEMEAEPKGETTGKVKTEVTVKPEMTEEQIKSRPLLLNRDWPCNDGKSDQNEASKDGPLWDQAAVEKMRALNKVNPRTETSYKCPFITADRAAYYQSPYLPVHSAVIKTKASPPPSQPSQRNVTEEAEMSDSTNRTILDISD